MRSREWLVKALSYLAVGLFVSQPGCSAGAPLVEPPSHSAEKMTKEEALVALRESTGRTTVCLVGRMPSGLEIFVITTEPSFPEHRGKGRFWVRTQITESQVSSGEFYDDPATAVEAMIKAEATNFHKCKFAEF